jgi:hypothetical protein
MIILIGLEINLLFWRAGIASLKQGRGDFSRPLEREAKASPTQLKDFEKGR